MKNRDWAQWAKLRPWRRRRLFSQEWDEPKKARRKSTLFRCLVLTGEPHLEQTKQ